MAARSFLGAGDVYIERIVNGVGLGLEGPFAANKLSVQPNVDTKQSTSKGRYDYGQVLETVNLQQPSELAVELKEVVGAVLAMALMGTTAALAATSGSMSAQAVTAVKGKWAPTNHLNLAAGTGITVTTQTARTGTYVATGGNTGNFTSSAVTAAANTLTGAYTGTFTAATTYNVVAPGGAAVGSGVLATPFAAGGLGFTLTAGATPAVAGDSFTITVAASGAEVAIVEGTDYELNRPLGWIRLMSTSAVPNGASLKVTGAYAGSTGTRVAGGTQPEIRCRIVLDGINKADGSEVTAEIYEAVLSADSEFDFLPDDFGNVSLTGTTKTPAGKSEPFIVDLKTPV